MACDLMLPHLHEDDFALTMAQVIIGDELVLEPGKDFTVKTDKDKTVITVNYIYWANIPVYKTMTVDINTAKMEWDSQKYTWVIPFPTIMTLQVYMLIMYERWNGRNDRNGPIWCGQSDRLGAGI